MKSLSILIVCISALSIMSFSNLKLKKVIFFGDSITQAGVNAGGYITLMQEMLKAQAKDKEYEFVGSGIGGNKIYDLYLRAEDDVLSKNPDVVVIYVGVNDVWHKASSGTGTDADKFEKFYKALVKRFQDKNIEVILTTPAAIGERTDFTNSQDGDLNYYSNIIRKIASTSNCGLVDLRKELLAYNLANNPENKDRGILTTDRVHLNAAGNAFVAKAMWAAVVK